MQSAISSSPSSLLSPPPPKTLTLDASFLPRSKILALPALRPLRRLPLRLSGVRAAVVIEKEVPENERPETFLRDSDGPHSFSASSTSVRARFERMIRSTQDEVCAAIEAADGVGKFKEDVWSRAGGGGGISRVLQDGGVWEKAGVNVSVVYGMMPPEAYRAAKGGGEAGDGHKAGPVPFFAAGINSSALPQRGGEVNLTLGGIDLNNFGSVVVREDKKTLLTVLFPDGRDGRAFTLKELMVEPAVRGTEYVINAAAEAGVRRVVFTSSVGAVTMDPNRGPDVVVDESCWSDLEFCKNTKNWYCYGKAVAEQAAAKMAEERGVDLVVINPVLVLGPLLQPNINASAVHVLKYLNGSAKSYANAVQAYVDVRDVAEAHIRAFEAPEAKGRYLCAESVLHRADVVRILAKLFPEYPIPTKCSDEKNPRKQPYKFSNQKLKDLGLEFTPATQCLYEMVKNLQERGHLPMVPSETPPPLQL